MIHKKNIETVATLFASLAKQCVEEIPDKDISTMDDRRAGVFLLQHLANKYAITYNSAYVVVRGAPLYGTKITEWR